MLPKVTIIVPSYKPDDKLISVVSGLCDAGFDDIVVVDDGGREEYKAVFEKVSQYPGCHVLTHEVNKGKGRALKTAFEYISANRSGILGVITVDGDNQHTAEDIVKCANRLSEAQDKVVIGCRDFSGKDVPARSKFGNNMTKFIFRVGCGIKISDTQTGLRAIPFARLPEFAAMEGERYEYETNMLLEMKRLGIEFVEVPIKTVYIEENESSHFNPVKDSIKIYKVIFRYIYKFVLSSLSATLVDISVFNVVLFFAKKVLSKDKSIFAATAVARAISSLFNYTMNRKAVFASDEPVRSSIVKYYVLAAAQIILSSGFVTLITTLFRINTQIMITVIKMIVDTTLFFASYKLQKKWVFKK